MHFEILVEDLSGKIALDTLVPKIIGTVHSCRIHPYKGIGRLPKDLRGVSDYDKRVLLDQLPRLLTGYGKSSFTDQVVVVVCDLDRKCLKEFRNELFGVLDSCNPKPQACFCIAVEELEAWLLGDIEAIRTAYPKAKNHILKNYRNDSICGTWELLESALSTGKKKTDWAANITKYMDVENNNSPSFRYFRDKLRSYVS